MAWHICSGIKGVAGAGSGAISTAIKKYPFAQQATIRTDLDHGALRFALPVAWQRTGLPANRRFEGSAAHEASILQALLTGLNRPKCQ